MLGKGAHGEGQRALPALLRFVNAVHGWYDSRELRVLWPPAGTVYRGSWRGLQVAVKSMVFGNDTASSMHEQRPLVCQWAEVPFRSHP